jgi:hypothetical protein
LSKPDIVLLIHEYGHLAPDSFYILSLMRRAWEENGYTVRLAQGVAERVPGDVAIMHVDTTVIADEYLEFVDRYTVTINARVRDISKDRFSTIMLQRNDSYAGPVIVKTKNNYGGNIELIYASKAGEQPLEGDMHQRPWRKIEHLDPHDYPIFESISQVPTGVWKNPKLIVEKFLSERNEHGHYVVRNWFFMGDQGFCRYMTSPDRIVKPADHMGREIFVRRLDEPVPAAVRELRERMGFDFGRFDFGIVDGQAIVYDTNMTPIVAGETLEMFRSEICQDLPEGLYAFL